MANTLSNLMPDLYEALDTVSRELVGFIPSVTLDSGIARAGVGEIVRSVATPAVAAEDVSPGQLPPDDGDQSIGNVPIQITKSRMVPFRWSGEEQKGVNNGPGYRRIRLDQVTQAFRTLTNEIEVFCGLMHVGASRATGTAGTAPFATDLSDPANSRKILSDNGAPLSNLQLVIDTTAGAKIRSLGQLTKANEAGTTELRAQGTLLEVSGFNIKESAGVQTSVIGSVTGTVTISASKGATALTATTAAAAAVALVAGDIITLAGDTNKYVVAAAATIGASTSGTVTIAAPGLLKTASSAAPTVVAAATRNMAFSRSAIVLATRAPALPEEGDMAEDRTLLVDDRSGLAFEVSMYKLYKRVRYEVAMAWGGAVVKPEHTSILLG
jgi:hypothetical protein